MKITNKDLKRRIIEISYKHKLSHIGSCLTAVDIIEEIYWAKKPKEKFILSCGHAGLALYCVIEKYLGVNAEKIWLHHGTHPDRCLDCHLDCSTGSLGQGLPISCGLALANRNKTVYTLLSDGEIQEGSCYEALEVAYEQKLSNLKIFINCNGFGAYKALERNHIMDRCKGFTNIDIVFRQTSFDKMPIWFRGQKAHYLTLNENQYKELLKIYA